MHPQYHMLLPARDPTSCWLHCHDVETSCSRGMGCCPGDEDLCCVIASDDEGNFAADDSWIEIELLREEYQQGIEAAARHLNGQPDGFGSGSSTAAAAAVAKSTCNLPASQAQAIEPHIIPRRVLRPRNQQQQQQLGIRSSNKRDNEEEEDEAYLMQRGELPPPGENQVTEVHFGSTPAFHEAVVAKMVVEVPRLIPCPLAVEMDVDSDDCAAGHAPAVGGVDTGSVGAGNFEESDECDEDSGSSAGADNDDWRYASAAAAQHSGSGKKRPNTRDNKKARGSMLLLAGGRKNAKRILFEPGVKALLDEAMVDKLMHPRDWVPRYAATKAQNMPKLANLIKRTGLSLKQVRQYMHNNARRGKKMVERLSGGGCMASAVPRHRSYERAMEGAPDTKKKKGSSKSKRVQTRNARQAHAQNMVFASAQSAQNLA